MTRPTGRFPRFHTIAELQTVRLDREGITTISNLEGLRNLHSLYLQAVTACPLPFLPTCSQRPSLCNRKGANQTISPIPCVEAVPRRTGNSPELKDRSSKTAPKRVLESLFCSFFCQTPLVE